MATLEGHPAVAAFEMLFEKKTALNILKKAASHKLSFDLLESLREGTSVTPEELRELIADCN